MPRGFSGLVPGSLNLGSSISDLEQKHDYARLPSSWQQSLCHSATNFDAAPSSAECKTFVADWNL
jgi:hypothetical protein